MIQTGYSLLALARFVRSHMSRVPMSLRALSNGKNRRRTFDQLWRDPSLRADLAFLARVALPEMPGLGWVDSFDKEKARTELLRRCWHFNIDIVSVNIKE